jgi:hypothetical protein
MVVVAKPLPAAAKHTDTVSLSKELRSQTPNAIQNTVKDHKMCKESECWARGWRVL